MKILQAPFTPWKQAFWILVASMIAMLVGVLLNSAHLYEPGNQFPWTISLSFLLIFAVLCSILSLRNDNFQQYWQESMYSFLGLAILGYGLARLVSGMPIEAAGSYKFIYIVVTFCFLVFMSLINVMKKLVNYAEKEEWNQPRRKS